MELLNKMKTSAGILSMVAAAGLVSVPVLMPARDDTTVQAAVAEVDWETVNWKEGLRKNRNPLSAADAETMWRRVQKEPQFQALPQVFKNLVEQNKDNYDMYDGNINTFVFDKQGSGGFFVSKIISLSFGRGGLSAIIRKLKAMKFVDEPQETQALHPKTKKYYVLPAQKTIRSLSGDDLAYVKAFTETVNRNIHYLGSTPIPRLDMKRVKQGDYIGMAMWPLALVQPQKLYEAYKKEISLSPDQVKEWFAKGDEETYRLQNMLGAPLYAPRSFAPEAKVKDVGNCFGDSTPEFLGINVASLCQARQVTAPDRVFPFAYKRYFEEAVKSCRLLRTGMENELKTLDKKSLRYRAVAEVVKQADKHLSQIEKAAEKYMEQADRIYLNPPHTLLDAKSAGVPRAVQRAAGRKTVAQTTRQYE